MFTLSSAHINDLLAYGKSKHDFSLSFVVEENNDLLISSPKYSVQSLTIDGEYRTKFRRNLTFKNVVFMGPLRISDTSLFSSLVFEDCVFETEVEVTRYQESIIFRGSNCFKGPATIESNDSENRIKISGQNFEQQLFLRGVYREVEFNDINRTLQTPKDLIIGAATIVKLSIKNSKFSCVLIGEFKDRQLGGLVKFSNQVDIDHLEASEVCINNIKVGLIFGISHSKIKKFRISNFVEGSNKMELKNECRISDAIVPLGILKNVEIANSDFEELVFTENNPVGNALVIEKTTISNKLSFRQVLNEGLISLNQVTIPPSGQLSIKGANLGKTNFLLCAFANATLDFENSRITEIFAAGTTFPKKVHLNHIPDYSQAQLAFGQLQTASQKQGDTIQSLEYHSREVEAHYKSITWFSKDFFKKFNLWLNKISNNFGRYWLRSAIFTFGSGAFFFSILLFSVSGYEWETWKDSLFSQYLIFMNPLRFREIETLFPHTQSKNQVLLSGWCYLWDFLGRVFVAYGYYQTIQAFRRFGRR